MVALLRTILGNAVNDATTFRTRFRFRVLKTLDIKEHEYRFKVGEREVVLSPLPEGVPIRESEWLVINVRGFDSEDAARTFAHKLRAASEISSVAARLGIDAGRDLPTGGFGQTVKDHFQKTTGLLLRDNIHGIDVFLDDPNVRIAQINLTAQVWKEPNPFLSDLGLFLDVADKTSDKTQDVILLLNYALMRSDPVAQIVFAVSAVEMLGQQEHWSVDQKNLLDQLATHAEMATIGTPVERREVSEAIKRGLQKIGLRQGVMRLLHSLDLGHLKNNWDGLYAQRSTLVHGLAPKPGADYTQLASETIGLCGQILLRVIAKDVPLANSHVDKFYKS